MARYKACLLEQLEGWPLPQHETGSRVVVDAETVDNFTACLSPTSYGEREREIFRTPMVHTTPLRILCAREIGVGAVGAANFN